VPSNALDLRVLHAALAAFTSALRAAAQRHFDGAVIAGKDLMDV
jgi:hypothetical protein